MLDFIKEIIDAENIEFWAPIVVWGAILSVVFIIVVFKFFRFLIPSRSERKAMRIVNEALNDKQAVSYNYSIKVNQCEKIEANIVTLNAKIEDNDRKINLLTTGKKKMGLFSKEKKAKVNARIKTLQAANEEMRQSIRNLRWIEDKMNNYISLKSAKVGDVVTLGKWGWRVMQRNGNKLLLIALRVLDISFNRSGWANGEIRQNCQSFYSTQFDKCDKELIVPVKNETVGENVITNDYVFILSPEQMASLPNLTWNTLGSRTKGNTIELFDVKQSWREAEWESKATRRLNDFIYDYDWDSSGRPSPRFNGTEYDRGWWLRGAKGQVIYVDEEGILRKNQYNVVLCGLRPAVYISLD